MFVLLTDISTRGIMMVLSQIETVNASDASVNQRVAQCLSFPVIPPFDKNRETRIGIYLNAELDPRRAILVLLPCDVLLDALCTVSQQTVELGLSHIISQ